MRATSHKQPKRSGPPPGADRLKPSDEECYRAVVARDTSYVGAFFTAVKTTGIFCRPGCGAKLPKRENVEFFRTASDALHAGYRPCKRCRPLSSGSDEPKWVPELMVLAESHAAARLTSHDLRSRGIDPVRAARFFKSRFGMTFQGYHRALRLGRAVRGLREGAAMTRAAQAGGYSSESGFREAFARVFGAAPSPDATGVLRARWMQTPLGPMLAIASDEALCLLEFIDRRALQTQIDTLARRMKAPVAPGSNAILGKLAQQLTEYFAGKRSTFDVPILAPGTEFQARVWEALRAIPPGQTRSYAQLARSIGRPSAVRAVARANGDNRLAILIPCHRVIGSDGTMTGYGGGVWRKEALLELESAGVGNATLFTRPDPTVSAAHRSRTISA